MSVKIAPNGEQLIRQQIADLEQELKQLRMDKNIAYHACGDDKLANPNFHKLEQDERILEEEAWGRSMGTYLMLLFINMVFHRSLILLRWTPVSKRSKGYVPLLLFFV